MNLHISLTKSKTFARKELSIERVVNEIGEHKINQATNDNCGHKENIARAHVLPHDLHQNSKNGELIPRTASNIAVKDIFGLPFRSLKGNIPFLLGTLPAQGPK